MPTVAAEILCPTCGQTLTSAEKGPSWCPDCEWNLGELGPGLNDVPPGWRWLVRRCHRTAFRLDGELFQKYSAHRPEKQEASIAGAILLVISLALMALVVGATVWGVVLFRQSFLGEFAGAGLLIAAVLLRPRLGRLPKRRMRLGRQQYPALFALLEDVAEAAGTRPPDVVVADFGYNAGFGRVGLRQRRVLILGLPLWLVLDPRQRVALLAHELGHQVNGDPARSLLVRPALYTFGMLARSTDVSVSDMLYTTRRTPNIFEVVVKFALKLFSALCLAIHIGLSALGFRGTQRAEYLADGIAADVAGSDALVGLFERTLLLDQIANIVGYNAETKTVSHWRGLADNLLTVRAAELPRLGQLTLRHTSLWASHPPIGRRLRMVRAWPASEARVAWDSERMRAVDRELLDWYKATHQKILGTRVFRREN
jgi:Zn-dependent protease with chaperone function